MGLTMGNGTAIVEVKWGKNVPHFSFSAIALRRTAVLASAVSKERMFSLKCVKDHGLWWDAVPSCPPCLCPLVTQQQAAGRAALHWDRYVPCPHHCNWKPLASSQTEVDLTGPASGLPKGQQKRKNGR